MTDRVPRNQFQRNPWKHGHVADGKQTPEYSAWAHMRQRCTNPNDKMYPDYGGRGITICDRWLESFEHFLADMGLKPSPKHSLERKNNDGGYSPDNCVWATVAEQNANTRHNVNLKFNGKTQNIAQWQQELRLPRNLIHARLKRGWSVEKALSTPLIAKYQKTSARSRALGRAEAMAEGDR